MYTIKGPLSGLAISIAVCGCAAESGPENQQGEDMAVHELAPALENVISANRKTERQMNLVDRVFVGDDAVIEFYEPDPGVIAVSVAGIAGGEVPDAEGTPEEVFFRYAKGRPRSSAFDAALDRRDSVASRVEQDEVSSEVIPGDELEESGGSILRPVAPETQFSHSGGHCSWPWLVEEVCDTRPGTWPSEWETPYWWHGRRIHRNSTSWTKGTVCADIGNVTFDVWSSGGIHGSWYVEEGTYRWWTRGPTTVCDPFCHKAGFYATYEVLNATNDRFHTCGFYMF